MFGLDPLNPAIAIAEMLLLLGLAAFVGWLLGRLVHGGRISALRSAIAKEEADLNECRQAKRTGLPASPVPNHQPPVTIPAETVFAAPAPGPPRPVPVPETSSGLVADEAVLPAQQAPTAPPEPVAAEPLAAVEVPPLGAPIPEVPAILPPIPPVLGTAEPANGTPGVGNSEAAVLSRIAARANELNFDRIGRATAAEADDLKDIVGIGPFLERKLHSLGIFTFRQVANFTREDIAKVNDIIEFFPGRIERDNWVDQSKLFHDRKYGQRS